MNCILLLLPVEEETAAGVCLLPVLFPQRQKLSPSLYIV